MSVKPHATRVVNLWKVQDMLNSGVIKLDAEYQRDIVWPSSKMSMLIDSLMKKYYIPPLLFAVRIDDNGERVRVCIDGKQRLTSILRFTQNKIPYLEESSGIVEEVYFEQNDTGPNVGLTSDRTYLSEEDRENFNDTEIVMIEFSELDEDQELEIFARVQMGVSITAAEKLLATNSPASKFCRELLTTHPHLDSLLRGAKAVSFQYVSQLLYILKEETPDKYVASHARLMEFLKDRSAILSDSLKRKVRRTIGLLDALCQDEAGKKAFYFTTTSQGTSKREPIKNIEFTIFGLYVSEVERGTPITELAADLASLRKFLREEYQTGLYAGNPCWKAGRRWTTRTQDTKKRRAASNHHSSATTSSFLRNGATRNVVEDSEEVDDLCDDDDYDDDDQQQQQRGTISASKRRRGGPSNHVIVTKQEDDANSPQRPKALARRGGKRSF
ncbi:hypothetical protein [Absidia glauca]|uniref:GmrSD restriction endonucleases N-terminal domain-containing protein n=1 Tax=Absidia glauca TaxID=4829 RepID=A0A163THM0_ABSGL|nr:hypothetical protein [Absidia glauca]